MLPDFEEKQFEMAANGELREFSPHIYTPGQVAEKLLGFDAAALYPMDGPLWSLLKVGAPSGLQLVSNLWPVGTRPGPSVTLPSYVVSVIVQYKRSDYLTTQNATQYSYWREEYFRFNILEHQQVQLLALEKAASHNAVVRYAAPTFYQYSVLEARQLSRRILASANYVSPAVLGVAHTAWTYTQPGVDGFANPDGERLDAESWSQVAAALETRRAKMTILQHLRELASGIEGASLFARPPRKMVDAEGQGDAALAQGVRDLLTVGSVVGRAGASWWISAIPAES